MLPTASRGLLRHTPPSVLHAEVKPAAVAASLVSAQHKAVSSLCVNGGCYKTKCVEVYSEGERVLVWGFSKTEAERESYLPCVCACCFYRVHRSLVTASYRDGELSCTVLHCPETFH